MRGSSILGVICHWDQFNAGNLNRPAIWPLNRLLYPVSPKVGPAVLQPKNARRGVRRVKLADWGLNHLPVNHPNINLIMLVAIGSGKQAALYALVGLSLAGF